MEKKRNAKNNPLRKGILKLLLIMRLSFVIHLLVLLQVSASTYSQNTRLSLKVENVTFMELFTTIKKQSEFTFVYNVDDIEKLGRVSCEFHESTVEQVLDYCLKTTNMSYKVRDNVVILSPKEILKKKIDPLPVKQPQPKGTGTIKGNITDEDGLPMVGAIVLVDQTTIGTITDDNGNFQLPGIPAYLIVNREK
jgi:TonB-dependent starch-binding outer membrane protein SusC